MQPRTNQEAYTYSYMHGHFWKYIQAANNNVYNWIVGWLSWYKK